MKVNSINRVYESVNNPTNKMKREMSYNKSSYNQGDSFEKVLREDMSSNEDAYKKAKDKRKKEVIIDEDYLLWAFENGHKVSPDKVWLPDTSGQINSRIDFSKIPNIYSFLNKFYDINYSTLTEVFELGSFLIDTGEISYKEFNFSMDSIIDQINSVTRINIKDPSRSDSLRISWTGVFDEFIHSLNKVGNYSEANKYKNIFSIFKNIENSNKININLGHGALIHIR